MNAGRSGNPIRNAGIVRGAVAFAFVVATLCHDPAAFAQIGRTTTIEIPPQAWQKRRAERLLILSATSADQIQITKLDKLLTEFETHPMAQTPMENMDILGYFYAPKDGIDKALPIIVMNATLGWYDALRFGSESGRAEIANNEGFFNRALVLAGKQKVDDFLSFAKAHPDQTRSAIEQGLTFAEKFRSSDDYDRKWPTAYGLERIICAQGGAARRRPRSPRASGLHSGNRPSNWLRGIIQFGKGRGSSWKSELVRVSCKRARSSAEDHYLDMVGVTGSKSSARANAGRQIPPAEFDESRDKS